MSELVYTYIEWNYSLNRKKSFEVLIKKLKILDNYIFYVNRYSDKKKIILLLIYNLYDIFYDFLLKLIFYVAKQGLYWNLRPYKNELINS